MIKKTLGASGNIKVSQDENNNYIIDIDPTFKGQVSINTVGTISVGDWQANIIDPEFGGTGHNNKGSSLQLNGNTIINGPLVINCDNNEHEINLYISKSGSVAIKEDSLQIDNMLSEFKHEGIASLAYDNISPNQEIGDITYHDGLYNKSLSIGEEDTYLSVENNIPAWKRHPKYLRYIKNNSKTFESATLKFSGQGIISSESFEGMDVDDTFTNVMLHPSIESLAQLSGSGMLTFNHGWTRIGTFQLQAGEGISIQNPNGLESEDDIRTANPVISISPHYTGQETIRTLGFVKTGKWEADVIKPEFGGTGVSNKYNISIGGELRTNCGLNIVSHGIHKEVGVNFAIKDVSFLELPPSGMVATVQQSLQAKNNLLDVSVPKEAFRNISPTEKKGDLIVRAIGDYDTRLPVGKFGEVLSANPDNNLGVEWVDLKLEERIENVLENLIRKNQEDKKDNQTQLEDEHNCKLNKFINAIMTQIDHMARTNQIKLLSEMKSALQEWQKSII